ncbi:MAG: hypothetical protein ABI589_06865 [Burkholderiales bacterium]
MQLDRLPHQIVSERIDLNRKRTMRNQGSQNEVTSMSQRHYGESIRKSLAAGFAPTAGVFDERQARTAAELTLVVGGVAFALASRAEVYLPIKIVATVFFIEFAVWQAFLPRDILQRIWPNWIAGDPRVEANTPLAILGEQGFQVAGGGEGAKQQTLGCLAIEREAYNELPPPLRWGDFKDIRLGTFEELRDAFAQVAKAPVALEGTIIEAGEP